MIVDAYKNKKEKSEAYKNTSAKTQNSSYAANVVSLAAFSSKKDDESALERILARANKQTW